MSQLKRTNMFTIKMHKYVTKKYKYVTSLVIENPDFVSHLIAFKTKIIKIEPVVYLKDALDLYISLFLSLMFLLNTLHVT